MDKIRKLLEELLAYFNEKNGLIEREENYVKKLNEILSEKVLPKDYTIKTLGEFLSSKDETIRRNAISILKQLQNIA